MADSEYPYPPDRFDEEADGASFHGAHRAEEPFWRQNLLYLVIIAAALVLLIVLVFAIGGRGGGGGADERSADPTTPAASESGEEAAEETAEEAAPQADLSVPVLVVNAGGIDGLAGTWRDALEDAGWQDVSVQTADETVPQPAVLYRDEADAESAQALAQQVGAGEAQQSDEYDARLTVVAVTEPTGDLGDGASDGGEG